MSEYEWRDSPDVGRMFEAARGRVSHRRLRLFAAGCVRLAWRWLVDDRSRSAVEVAERLAYGAAGEAERAAAERAARAAAVAVCGGPSPWRGAVAAVVNASRLSRAGRPHMHEGYEILVNAADFFPAAERAWLAAAPFPDLKKRVGRAVKETVRAVRSWREYVEAARLAQDYYDTACARAESSYHTDLSLARWAWECADPSVERLDAAVQSAARAAAACCAAEGFADGWRGLPPKGQMRLLRKPVQAGGARPVLAHVRCRRARSGHRRGASLRPAAGPCRRPPSGRV